MVRRVLSLALLATTVAAQEWNPFLEYKAELQQYDAPPWMKEGTRLYWECAGSGYISATQPRDTPHASGAGYLTADVVSLIGHEAAIATRVQLSSANNFGQPMLSAPSVETGYVTPAASGGPFWVHPDILLKAFRKWPVVAPDKDGGFPQWAASRAPYEWNGRKIMALHWTLGGGPKYVQYERFSYEEATGLLLFYSSSPQKSAESGRQTVALTRFLGRRDRQLPWALGRPPAWLGRIASYTYSGNWTVQIPGVEPQLMPIGATLMLHSLGTNFITLKTAPDPNVPGGRGADPGPLRVAGPTQTGGLWLPPLEIPKLRAGMVVDRDEILAATVTVAFVGQSDYGRNVVRIVEDAAGYTQYCDYERETGILLVVAVQDKILNKVTQVYFTGKQRGATAPGGR